MIRTQFASIGTALLTPVLAVGLHAASGVQIIQKPGKLRVEINGQLFTEYCYEGAPHLYYYPVIGPAGLRVTRAYPMDPNSKGEDHDHPHHRSLWYSHGDVNGVDFWSESPRAGKIVHDKFLEVQSGEQQGVIRSRNKWVAPNGEVVCTDERTFRVYARPDHERVFDFEIRLFAGDKPVVLGDTKEGSMGIRVAESMRLKPNRYNQGKPTGHIVQSTGVRDDATWGKRAAWTDYYGPVEGHIVGVAIFDHPSNPRHPTWWHVRNYGLFAANPFGVHDFERKPRGTGDMRIEPGQSVAFRYRFYIHEGDTTQARVAERYAQWVAESKSKADAGRAQLPEGYALVYQQDFERPNALSEFVMTDPQAWQVGERDGNHALALVRQSKYKPPVRSPLNMALIADKKFGDFVLEADLIQTGREYGHRDMCLFFGFQNPSQFYYVHIATRADDHAHNVFIVNKQPRTKIARQTTGGVNWGLNQWHHVRLERRLADGLIQVYFDDMTKPIMVAEDKTFGAGYVGFGSFDDTGMVDNIRIWGPAAQNERIGYFKPATRSR